MRALLENGSPSRGLHRGKPASANFALQHRMRNPRMENRCPALVSPACLVARGAPSRVLRGSTRCSSSQARGSRVLSAVGGAGRPGAATRAVPFPLSEKRTIGGSAESSPEFDEKFSENLRISVPYDSGFSESIYTLSIDGPRLVFRVQTTYTDNSRRGDQDIVYYYERGNWSDGRE
jgi:hypothetical protein